MNELIMTEILKITRKLNEIINNETNKKIKLTYRKMNGKRDN